MLATEATALAHGAEAAAEAAETARLAFEEGEAADTLPSVEVPRGDLAAGIPAFRLFALAGLAGSNGEARRLIRGGGARINDVPGEGRGPHRHGGRPARRRDQAVGRPQAPPAGAGGVALSLHQGSPCRCGPRFNGVRISSVQAVRMVQAVLATDSQALRALHRIRPKSRSSADAVEAWPRRCRPTACRE